MSSGIPAFITETSSGIVMLAFNFIILRLQGTVGVAAYGVVAAISLVVVAMYTGLSQGIQPVISRNHGLKNIPAVRLLLKYALVTIILLSGAIYSLIFTFAAPIASAFNSEHNTILQELAIYGLRVYFTACPFLGFNIVFSTYLISTERPRPAQIISLLRGFFVIIPTTFLLSAVFKMTGVWCAFPVTELIAATIGIFYGIRKRQSF